MKKTILTLTMISSLGLLTSCGKNDVGTHLKVFSHNFVHDIGKGIEHLGQQPKNLTRDLLGINQDKKESKQGDAKLQKQIDALLLDIKELYSLVGDVNEEQDSLSQAIAINVANLAEIESEERVVDFIDPCGDKPNAFDEILMVTAKGKHVAYFQSGNKRFLTVLPNGSYRTTDSQSCRFSIINGEYVENNA